MAASGFPSRSAQWLASDGLISQVWYTFLYNLWTLLGGASGLDNTGVVYFDGSGLVSTQVLSETSGPASPTGTTSTTQVMMGLASGLSNTFEVRTSSNILITVCGEGANNSSGSGFKITLRWGSGTRPTNGQAVTGTQIGVQSTFGGAAGLTIPFSITGLAMLAEPGTAYWIDVALSVNGGFGTATLTDVAITYLAVLYLPIPA